jgi:hypothetical protein
MLSESELQDIHQHLANLRW